MLKIVFVLVALVGLVLPVFGDANEDMVWELDQIRQETVTMRGVVQSNDAYLYLIQTQAAQHQQNSEFLAQVGAFGVCFLSGCVSWLLFLKAKDAKRFW